MGQSGSFRDKVVVTDVFVLLTCMSVCVSVCVTVTALLFSISLTRAYLSTLIV